MNIEDFRSGGVLPGGPVSAWPKSRNESLSKAARKTKHDTQVKVGAVRMAQGAAKAAKQAAVEGKVSAEIREERMETCRACPHFIEDSKRCSECGCFMELKSWIGGNPDHLCPKKKWVR